MYGYSPVPRASGTIIVIGYGYLPPIATPDIKNYLKISVISETLIKLLSGTQ